MRRRAPEGRRGGRQPVVPQAVKGRIRRIKWLVLLLTLRSTTSRRSCAGTVAPTRRIRQSCSISPRAALLSFSSRSGRRTSIWSRGFSILASTILILTNALAGRLWCGFACPQTVWTDLFLLVERLIEGDRRQRLKNLGAPLDAKRAHADRREAFRLAPDLARYRRHADLLLHRRTGTAATASCAGDVSANALCWIVCLCRHHLRSGRFRARAGLHIHVSVAAPPGRDLGSGSLSRSITGTTAASSARRPRRPPNSACRASRREIASTAIMCVTVCPIGIDIREGPNFACINCGLCVDACDSVMSKLGRPRGLIDYESWNNIERGHRAEPRSLPAGAPEDRRD